MQSFVLLKQIQHEEKKAGINIMYKTIQYSYRTRKVFPCKTSVILPMDTRKLTHFRVQNI